MIKKILPHQSPKKIGLITRSEIFINNLHSDGSFVLSD